MGKAGATAITVRAEKAQCRNTLDTYSTCIKVCISI